MHNEEEKLCVETVTDYFSIHMNLQGGRAEDRTRNLRLDSQNYN
jgi:hypothetical protein